jgi:hypothetical protein
MTMTAATAITAKTNAAATAFENGLVTMYPMFPVGSRAQICSYIAHATDTTNGIKDRLQDRYSFISGTARPNP